MNGIQQRPTVQTSSRAFEIGPELERPGEGFPQKSCEDLEVPLTKISCDRHQNQNRFGACVVATVAGSFGFLILHSTLRSHQYGWLVLSLLFFTLAAHFLLELVTFTEYFLNTEKKTLVRYSSRFGRRSEQSFPFSTLRKVVLKTIGESENSPSTYSLTIIGNQKFYIGSWTCRNEAKTRATNVAEAAEISVEDYTKGDD